MFVMMTVAALCAIVLIASLVALMCRHPKTEAHRLVSDDAILCFVSPLLVIIVAAAGISAGWRITHGGFGAVAVEAWIGVVVIVAAAVGIWVTLSRKIRALQKD